jgi:hypothetical protein
VCSNIALCRAIITKVPSSLLTLTCPLLLSWLQVELVDRQLMSSLMGEWGMLQQLQGLANTFLIASPAMVEWVDALFTAVECTRPAREPSRRDGVSTPTSASKTLPRTAALAAGGLSSGSPGVMGSPGGAGAAAAASAAGVAVHVGHLEVASLAALLQVSCGVRRSGACRRPLARGNGKDGGDAIGGLWRSMVACLLFSCLEP